MGHRTSTPAQTSHQEQTAGGHHCERSANTDVYDPPPPPFCKVYMPRVCSGTPAGDDRGRHVKRSRSGGDDPERGSSIPPLLLPGLPEEVLHRIAWAALAAEGSETQALARLSLVCRAWRESLRGARMAQDFF